MKRIIALGASSSRQSINKTLAIHVASKMTETSMSIIDLNDYILPLFTLEYEEQFGIPEAVYHFNEQIENADGLIISLAEHNSSYTAVFKNLLDWLTRIDMKVWKDKPMFLMATSPGERGGANVLAAAKTLFPFIGGEIIADFSLPSYYDNFSNKGIVNTELAAKLNEKIAVFEQALANAGEVLNIQK